MAAETKSKEENRCAKYRVFKAIDDAYRKGDLDALLVALVFVREEVESHESFVIQERWPDSEGPPNVDE